MESVADILYKYLENAIYKPADAVLDFEKIPEDFQDVASGLNFFVECVLESDALAKALERGDLNAPVPDSGNEMASSIKSLYASLKHLTWQTKQIAKGDYKQEVTFMGEFSDSFNMMIELLAKRQKKLEDEVEALETQAYHDDMTHLYNRAYGMSMLNLWLTEKRRFVLIFVDLDRLKYINDEFGHMEGDMYITNAANTLKTFSADCVACRLGGDEFMLLVPDISYDSAYTISNEIFENFKNHPHLEGKEFSYSISFGIVAVDTDNKLPARDLLGMADEKMYENKRLRKMQRK